MENILIEPTKRTPYVNLDFDNHILEFAGESYPEDISAFYGEIISNMEEYFEFVEDEEITIRFELVYFNSSSAKAMIRMFDMFDAAADKNQVMINWIHEADDDNIAELGEEFGEDLLKADFRLIAKTEEGENDSDDD